jgi:hypothetical protein
MDLVEIPSHPYHCHDGSSPKVGVRRRTAVVCHGYDPKKRWKKAFERRP